MLIVGPQAEFGGVDPMLAAVTDGLGDIRPLPVARYEGAETQLYGRADEIATIVRSLEAARSGLSSVLVIKGEAGIGKTALLDLAAQHADGMRVLRCCGVESEIELAFAGLHQIAWPLVDRIDRLPAGQAAALRGAIGLGGSAGDRFMIAIALLTLLADLAEEQPLLLLVDDAHWLDIPSAEALGFVARRLAAEPMALLFSAREGAAREFRPPPLPTMILGGLDYRAAALLLDVQGHVLAPQVRDQLLLESHGNPLALLELSKTLSSEELQGKESLPRNLPLNSRLQQAYLERVHRLPEATRALLLVAAAEDSCDAGVVLAACARLQVGGEALSAAEQQGLVVADERRIRFQHPLVRSAVYQGATLIERRAVHRALAEVLVGKEHEDRRVWHLAAATIGHDDRVAAELEHSAGRSQGRNGPAAAAVALERAASLSAVESDRARRLVKAAAAAFNAGQWDQAHLLLDRAEPLATGAEILADLSYLRGLLQFETANLDTAGATLARGAEQARESAPDRAALMLAAAGRMAWLAMDLPRLESLRRQVLQLPGHKDSLSKRLALSQLGITLPRDRVPTGGFFAAAFECLEGSHLHPWLWPPSLHAALLGEDVAAYRLYSRAVVVLRSAGSVGQLAQALAGLSYSESYLGYWSNAVVHASEGLRLARETAQMGAAGACLAVLARISGGQGRVDDCLRYGAAARETVAGQGSKVAVAVTWWGLALLALGAGQYEDAYQHLTAITEPERWPDGSLFAGVAVIDLLEAAVLTDRLNVASDVLASLERWAMPYSPPWAQLAIHRTRALLAMGGDAVAEFEAALAVPGAELRRFELARTHLIYGEWLRRHRRKTEARAQLRTASAMFMELGAGPWSERAGAELRATGESICRRDPTAIEQLTPQELQIARLAAAGLSNREIGAQLFLSPRTVGFHLYNVFPKLGIASRGELRQLRLEDNSLSAPACDDQASNDRDTPSPLTDSSRRGHVPNGLRQPTWGELASTGRPVRAWKLEGTYFENCSCDWVCPCTYSCLTSPATEERCQIVLVYNVHAGGVDGVDVGGLSVAVVADTPKMMTDGNWRLGLIVDAAASDEQADKLTAVFSGQAGGPMAALAPLVGEVIGIERAPIEYRDDGQTHSAKVGDGIEIEIEDFVDHEGLPPTRLVNPFHPSNTTPTIAKATSSRIRAFGMEFQNEGRSAFSAPFSWAG